MWFIGGWIKYSFGVGMSIAVLYGGYLLVHRFLGIAVFQGKFLHYGLYFSAVCPWNLSLIESEMS